MLVAVQGRQVAAPVTIRPTMDVKKKHNYPTFAQRTLKRRYVFAASDPRRRRHERGSRPALCFNIRPEGARAALKPYEGRPVRRSAAAVAPEAVTLYETKTNYLIFSTDPPPPPDPLVARSRSSFKILGFFLDPDVVLDPDPAAAPAFDPANIIIHGLRFKAY
ncbi:hypothetical protein EVAR_92972_1 [Eumeta japonica]|uniref:Uncharacterized protein n=1 Tax=Eumeta variegata TaxID=151549 RepID=A0A4C1TAF7_EUMVA|nr:hypothetical protein EVAR_92972_1 [Eumeta japonica]